MLAYIKGILEIKTKGYIVVEAGGLGYKIFMPESTIAKTGNIGDKVQIKYNLDNPSQSYCFLFEKERKAQFKMLLLWLLKIFNCVFDANGWALIISRNKSWFTVWLNDNIRECFSNFLLTIKLFNIRN